MTTTRIRWSSRMRVAGHLLLWVGEWVSNSIQMARFLVRRRSVRREMRELIAGAAPRADDFATEGHARGEPGGAIET